MSGITHVPKFLKKKMEPKSLRLSKEMVLSSMNLVFPVEEVSAYKKKMEKSRISDAKFESDGAKILSYPCDILIPAAMEGVITEENGRNYSVKLWLKLPMDP